MIWISSKEFKPVMHLKGDAFNQQLQNLINKYPEIKKSMKYDFVPITIKMRTERLLLTMFGTYKNN